MTNKNEENLVHQLMVDVSGSDINDIEMSRDDISDTIKRILKKYDLSPDTSFIENYLL